MKLGCLVHMTRQFSQTSKSKIFLMTSLNLVFFRNKFTSRTKWEINLEKKQCDEKVTCKSTSSDNTSDWKKN